jgi:Mce-associated membrane protein
MTAAYQSAATNAATSTNLAVSGIGLVVLFILVVGAWRMFTKAGKPGWASIVPFYNAYVLLKIVGRPGWWLVLLFIPLVNIVIGIIVAIDLARAFGRGAVFGVLCLFLLSPIGYAVIGFGDARYRGPDGTAGDSGDSGVDASDPATSVREPNYNVLGGIALVVVAAFTAIWFGVSWIQVANDASISQAKARDEVDRIGRAAIITFHTLDYHKVDEGLDNWLNASTGGLHDEVVGRRESSKQAIAAAKTVTVGNVLSLAVTELNVFEGKATVIAAVEVDVTPDGKPVERKYLRILGALERAGDGWKLSGIQQVPFAQS